MKQNPIIIACELCGKFKIMLRKDAEKLRNET